MKATTQKKTQLLVTILAASMLPFSVAAEPAIAVIAADNCETLSTVGHVRNYRNALDSRLGSEVQSEATTIAKLGGSRSSMSLAEVERLLSGATADIFQDQVDRAARTLAAVVEDVERLPPTPARYRAFTDVLAALGHTQLLRGEPGEAEAAKYYTRILRIEPGWSPNINVYPPTTRAFVARLRAKLDREPKVALRITSRPAGKLIHIDTKPLGPAPVSVEVSPSFGSYAIEADWGGERRGLAHIVKLERAMDVELDATFEGSVYADKGCAQSDGTREGRLALATRLAGVLDATTIHVLWEDEPSPKERFLTVATVSHKGEQLLEARIRIHAGGLRSAAFESMVNFALTGEAGPPIEPVRGGVKRESGAAQMIAAVPAIAADPPSRGRIAIGISGATAAAFAVGSTAFFLSASATAGEMDKICPRAMVCSNGAAADQFAAHKTIHDSQMAWAVSLAIAAGTAAITMVALIVWSTVSGEEVQPVTAAPGGAAVLLRF